MRLLPWAVACVLCVALLPTPVVVLTADYGLNGAVAGGLAVAQAAVLRLAVVRPLRAWYVVFVADVTGAFVLFTVDFQERLLWPPPMEFVGYVGLCVALGRRQGPSGGMDVRYDLGNDHRLVGTLCPDMKLTLERPDPVVVTAVTRSADLLCKGRGLRPDGCVAWALLTGPDLDATTLVRALGTWFGRPA